MSLAIKNPKVQPRSKAGLKVDKDAKLSPEEMATGFKSYLDWHWGIAPTTVVEWPDPLLPDILTQCGKLCRISFRAPRDSGKHPRRERDTMIQLSRELANECHIAYDPNHPYQRLYFLLTPAVRRIIVERFWRDNKAKPISLNSLAQVAGGHHATDDYPEGLAVKPVGILVSVVYETHKEGDPPSFYRHAVGEVTHTYPILAADSKGRLWVAGGSTTSPTPGITN